MGKLEIDFRNRPLGQSNFPQKIEDCNITYFCRDFCPGGLVGFAALECFVSHRKMKSVINVDEYCRLALVTNSP